MAGQTYQEQMSAINSYLHSDDYGIEEEHPKYICTECKEGIFEGDEYWLIDNDLLCKNCLDKLFRYFA